VIEIYFFSILVIFVDIVQEYVVLLQLAVQS